MRLKLGYNIERKKTKAPLSSLIFIWGYHGPLEGHRPHGGISSLLLSKANGNFSRIAKIRPTLLAPYFLSEKPMKMQMGWVLLCVRILPQLYRLSHPGPGIQLHYPWSKCRAQGCVGSWKMR